MTIAIAAMVATPAMQLLLHWLCGSGFFATTSRGSITALGVLYNPIDNLSYAAWAQQSAHGSLLFENLYTTDRHAAAYFNAYFQAVGRVAGLLGVPPTAIMTGIAVLCGPLAGLSIYGLCRRLHFHRDQAAAATFLSLWGSGPSWIISLCNDWLAAAGMPINAPLGVDVHYLDLLPVTTLLLYPYQAAAFAMVCVLLLAIVHVHSAVREHRGVGCWQIAAMLLLGVLPTVRPYETIMLSSLLLATAAIEAWRSGSIALPSRFTAIAVCGVPGTIANIYAASLPVWRTFADGSIGLVFGRYAFIVGLGLLWLLGLVGAVRAICRRRADLLFFVLWSAGSIVLLAGFGGFGSKFAGVSVVASCILGGYAIPPMLRSVARRFPRTGKAVSAAIVVLAVVALVGTPLQLALSLIRSGAPAVDRELYDAAVQVASPRHAYYATILTTSRAGALLPGLLGVRVFVGHPILSPDYHERVARLTRAGIEPNRRGEPQYDVAALAALIAEARPDAIVVNRSAGAVDALTRCYDVAYAGADWITFVVARRDDAGRPIESQIAGLDGCLNP